ncbi:MAG: hypothetical protein IBX50_19585 [Marinospirillum sp.]|uniref:hypothetical protein n=1 Tax=Marinospirillum sp. TaxID=2183934 RepID=UPI001A0D004D|nr:hypothetical protein [Marinospirillum sp.]MBE0508893.1 hypothetical protein [Marinospirillum sp.]
MKWYRNIKAVLSEESETWLCYLYGQQTKNLPFLMDKKPKYRGLLLQTAIFFYSLIKSLRLKEHSELRKPTNFFVFAGSTNQMRSLDQTLDALSNKGEQLVVVGNSEHLADGDYAKGYLPFQLTPLDVLGVLVFFVTRWWVLYQALKVLHPVSVDWHFSKFCSVHTYLVYFYRVLSCTRPEFVITANDHNVPNRCMLAVAHHLGIKTVYLQHASVSSIFPALRVNYAFLDGQCALDTYLECEPNQPNTTRIVPIPQVILSGQKKQLKRVGKSSINTVGVALNALDDVQKGIAFVNNLVAEGVYIRLRWHPGQGIMDTQAYRDAFEINKKVVLSDPKQETISDFMENIGWLIAGNSSIHLEAALAGVMPIYYELTPPDHPDYYGYVKHGLTQPAESIEDILKLLRQSRENHSPNEQAVRYFSSTYLTEWDGKEGELVAETLIRLSAGENLPVKVIEFIEKEVRAHHPKTP